MKELAKTYDPKQVEAPLYKKWEDSGYFKPDMTKTKPFTIVIPPPNITGQLHMGHALDNMVQDATIRYKRMNGFATLWLPGTDHASIATEVKIVDAMAEEGLKKADIGREQFMKRAWAWREEFGGRIVNQLKLLGSSCDWSRERFTLDEGCSKAVVEVFVNLYNKGLIYRGNRIINWCPSCRTALSDAEVEYENRDSHLWFVKYTTPDGTDSVTIATTRPETMPGDTAIAVNPGDARYAHLVGKTVVLPVVGKHIPVIADSYVDMEFGTGALKITPAHDPNDFEVAGRHNLEILRVFTDDGFINEHGGVFAGQNTKECRENIVAELKKCGALVKIEDYSHNVGTCYRCKSTVEPLTSLQWFVDMKPLAKPAIAAVRNGEIAFVPERFDKIYFNWMENIRDWCISRQLWWGHRIPAWYCDDCGQMTVCKSAPTVCPKCGSANLRQDEDALDTWFSSGMWPFSTLGWPEQTSDLKFFYPTDVLVTGYDIIFFWVARMIVMGIEVMGQNPFSFVNVHGIVRDGQGRKMSKSLGNGIDPLDVIEKHGADALRFSLASGSSAGADMRFYWEKVEAAGNFANKIWNAARFVLLNCGDEKQEIDPAKLDIADKWILTKLSDAVKDVTECMEKFELGIAAGRAYEFLWNEYCDWYIEMTKPRLYGDGDKKTAVAVLQYVLSAALKLLHPFMPFITDEIYTKIPGSTPTIMTADWPTAEFAFSNDTAAMEKVISAIRQVRAIRAEMGVCMGKKAKLLIRTASPEVVANCRDYLTKLAYATDVTVVDTAPEQSVSIVGELGEIFIPLGELVDLEKERERLIKEKERLIGEIARAEGKLNNERFVSKAPESVVADEREKIAKYKEMLAKVEERLI